MTMQPPPDEDRAALVYATFPDLAAAEHAAGALLDAKLAACVNILPGVVSLYVWQGTRQRDAEVLMLAKTRRVLATEAIATLKAHHPYEVPAISIIEIAAGHAPFLDWIRAETRGA
jgi:periplasmic divalent cation tolerance protein